MDVQQKGRRAHEAASAQEKVRLLTGFSQKAINNLTGKTDTMNSNPSHKFQKGNKFSKGGVKGNKGGGRDSAKRKEVKRMVAEEVKAFIEKEVRPVLGIYKKIAMGVKRKRFNPKSGKAYFESEYDPPTVRDWVGKFVPSVHRNENTWKDGRPLVPVTIIAPDPNGPIPGQPEQ